MKKPRGEAILKNMGDALQEAFYQELRHTTQAKAIAWLFEKHGIKVSAGTVTAFWQWYPRSRTLRLAAASSDQLEATIKKIPELKVTAEQASRVAQINFEIQAAMDRDPVLYSSLRRGELEKARLQLEREKFEHSKKEDWEKGLDALMEEIKGNADALQHFDAMKAALKKDRS